MSTLSQHLDKIVAEISVDQQISALLKEDFIIIRNYLLDILRKDIFLSRIISETTSLIDKPFNACFLLDLSTSVAEIKLEHDGILSLVPNRTGCAQFMLKSFMSNARSILEYMRYVIASRLSNGCFVRGGGCEVYELELEEQKQSEFITIDVIFDNRVVTIDFMVLIKATQHRLQPFPPSEKKNPWLVAVAYNRFSVYVPKLDARVAQCGSFVLAYRLLKHVFAERDLIHIKDFFVVSALYEVFFAKYSHIDLTENYSPSVVDVTLDTLQRFVRYFKNDCFPFYWNTSVNLLKYFYKSSTKSSVHRKLVKLLVDIQRMNKLSSLDSDEVLELFGIQANSETFKVDQFGIFKTF